MFNFQLTINFCVHKHKQQTKTQATNFETLSTHVQLQCRSHKLLVEHSPTPMKPVFKININSTTKMVKYGDFVTNFGELSRVNIVIGDKK